MFVFNPASRMDDLAPDEREHLAFNVHKKATWCSSEIVHAAIETLLVTVRGE